MGQAAAVTAPPQTGQALIRAIATMQRISFTYEQQKRYAEPQCLGFTSTGAETLRAYLPKGGGSVSEPLFTVAKMSDFVVLDERFSRPGPHYKKGDSAMKTILAEL